MLTQMARQLALQNEMRERQISMQLAMGRRTFMVRKIRKRISYYSVLVNFCDAYILCFTDGSVQKA